MYVRACVFMCVCVHTSVCVAECVRVLVCVPVRSCVCECLYVCMCECVHVLVCVTEVVLFVCTCALCDALMWFVCTVSLIQFRARTRVVICRCPVVAL